MEASSQRLLCTWLSAGHREDTKGRRGITWTGGFLVFSACVCVCVHARACTGLHLDRRVSGLQRACVCVCVCARACVHWAPPVTEQGGKVAGGQMSCWKPLEGGGDPGLGSEVGGGWVDLENSRNILGGNSMSKHVALEAKCGHSRD